jgi:enterochelin esterase family protein
MLEMPDAAPQPWIIRQPGVAEGRIERRPFNSAELKNEREVGIYLPPQYSPHAEPYPLLVLFDEWAYLGETGQQPLVPTPTILDNLIAAGRIPPMVALFLGNPAGARDRELGCNPEFTRSLVTELLPWAHGLNNFTKDPRRTIVGGSSRGGFASACAALWQPETFGNVLAQSGSFHLSPPSSGDATDSKPEPNWLARQFIASPRKPLRFYLDAGSAEFDVIGDGSSILTTTHTLRDVLRAKGYEVHFQEFPGGHDYLGWRGTLADGLMALMGTTASKGRGEGAPPEQ